MSRVMILVEGQTELNFVKFVLGPILNAKGVYPSPVLFRARGGSFRYLKIQRDITNSLKAERNVYVTTLVDYYGMPTSWPGREAANSCQTVQEKATAVEDALKSDIQIQMGESFNPVRFIPYVQMHEFEALMFSCPQALADSLKDDTLLGPFQKIRDNVDSPEDINDNYDTCPSRRIKAIYLDYDKVVDGTRVAKAIGLDKMRAECPHFNTWITQLESLAN